MSAVADLEQIHKHLDVQPGDWVTRAVLADLYDELGDTGRARVQRWLVKHRRHPVRYRSSAPAYWHDTRWGWWLKLPMFDLDWRAPGRIPWEVFHVLEKHGSCIYESRQQAEDDLLRVLDMLEEAE